MIRSIEIRGLRGIREGRLDNLAPLTILVGPNGSGKSTVLDALLIGASPTPADGIARAVQRRVGVRRSARWLPWKGRPGTECTLRAETGTHQSLGCALKFRPQTDADIVKCSLLDGGHALPPFQVRILADNRRDEGNESPFATKERSDLPGITLIDAHLFNQPVPLHQLYTKTVEQGRGQDAKAIIAEVVSGVKDIEILTEGDTPVVHLVFEDHSVPAALVGDGIHMVLRLALELASIGDGTALLEEPEVHQHPGSIRQSARALLAAVRRGIQVVLTTHSLELIDALLTSASEQDLDNTAVYRVQLDSGVLKSHRLSGKDAVFARTQIEDDLR